MNASHLIRLCALGLLLFFSATEAWGEKNEPPGDKTAGDKKKKSPPPEKKETASECVRHTVQARYVNGYDHLVHITNSCSRKATCKVSTDVNPDIQVVTLSSGTSTTVLTFRGSPAQEFRAKVECELEGAAD
jgi:hypothetical protein